MDIELLDNIEQFKQLKKGDMILVRLGEYDFITWENGVWKIVDILNSIR